MSLRDDAGQLLAPWRYRPRLMVVLHATACYRVFIPVPGNNDLRKRLASLLMLTWTVVTLGIAFNVASLGIIQYGAMTAVIYTIIGIQWGFELNNMPIAVDVTRSDGEENE